MSDKTVTKTFKELSDCNLIYEKKQGRNKPNLIYPCKIDFDWSRKIYDLIILIIKILSINCSVDTAYEEMALTKMFFHKEDKTLGYHIIQSFKRNKVSPKTANLIGKELAEELWGDKYQVIICTHINKENVHNHLILNSVSFVDGKKYHNSNS